MTGHGAQRSPGLQEFTDVRASRMLDHQVAEAVERTVAAAPVLTPEQLAAIRGLLRPGPAKTSRAVA